MPCLAVILALFLPRLTLFLVWLFSRYLDRAYQTVLWPLLGFFFLPYTTLAYALAMNSLGGLNGLGLVIFVLGVLADFGVLGGARSSRGRRYDD